MPAFDFSSYPYSPLTVFISLLPCCVNCMEQIWPLMFIRNQSLNGICIQGSFMISSGFCQGQYRRKICAQNSTELEIMTPIISTTIANSFPLNYSERCKKSVQPSFSKYNLKVTDSWCFGSFFRSTHRLFRRWRQTQDHASKFLCVRLQWISVLLIKIVGLQKKFAAQFLSRSHTLSAYRMTKRSKLQLRMRNFAQTRRFACCSRRQTFVPQICFWWLVHLCHIYS